MDHFGIGAAIRSVCMIYFRASRGTGRTVSLVESLKDGDRVVFKDAREADRVKDLCSARGVKIECVVIPPKDAGRVFQKPPSKGRTLFDHGWVEAYYLLALENAQHEIDYFERQTSGYGEAHRETLHRAKEISKWQT